ncbi:MAG: hypothetical protein M3069_21825 [Chloroflexota bacterium]|nr:hypothetical protein [Chloroflexota bacterium]
MIGAGVLISGRFELRRNVRVEDAVTTWEAFDTSLHRRVLIKLLRADLATDLDAIDHFRRDVRIAARGDSAPGTQVLDAGTDPTTNLPFAVFEWPERLAESDEQPPEPEWYALPGRDRTRVAPQVLSDRGGQSIGGKATRHALRGPQSLILLLLLVPLAAGVLFIRSFLQPQSAGPVGPGLFSLPSRAAATAVASTAPVSRSAPTQLAATPVATAVSAIPRPSFTSAPQAAGQRRRIANTDGIGVALRATPGGDKLPGKGYDEGVNVTLLEVQGTWAHIRGDDGREGWVLAVTLVP